MCHTETRQECTTEYKDITNYVSEQSCSTVQDNVCISLPKQVCSTVTDSVSKQVKELNTIIVL